MQVSQGFVDGMLSFLAAVWDPASLWRYIALVTSLTAGFTNNIAVLFRH